MFTSVDSTLPKVLTDGTNYFPPPSGYEYKPQQSLYIVTPSDAWIRVWYLNLRVRGAAITTPLGRHESLLPYLWHGYSSLAAYELLAVFIVLPFCRAIRKFLKRLRMQIWKPGLCLLYASISWKLCSNFNNSILFKLFLKHNISTCAVWRTPNFLILLITSNNNRFEHQRKQNILFDGYVWL